MKVDSVLSSLPIKYNLEVKTQDCLPFTSALTPLKLVLFLISSTPAVEKTV